MPDRAESAYMSTPVENLFIDECMGRASGDYVKVYLYGLRFALYPLDRDTELDEWERALHISAGEVERALQYWERCHVLTIQSLSPLRLKYLSVQQGLVQEDDSRAYLYRDFNSHLQSVAGSRQLQKEDFETVYDWIEVLGLDLEAIPLLVKHFVDTRHNMSFDTMDKKVRVLVKDQGVRTLEQVEAYVRGEVAGKPSAQVLRQWNIYRNATRDENRLYEKWTGSWGFDEPAILCAAGHMTGTRSPNFKYLDKVLDSLREQGLTHAVEVEGWYESGDRLYALMNRLGMSGPIPPELRQQETRWREQGFSREALLALAGHLARQGQGNVPALSALTGRLAREGKTEDTAVTAYLSAFDQAGEGAETLMKLWKLERAPTGVEKARYAGWILEGYAPELIAEAARLAQDKREPLPYMNAVLKAWREKGVTDPTQAAHAPAEGYKYDYEYDYDALKSVIDEKETFE